MSMPHAGNIKLARRDTEDGTKDDCRMGSNTWQSGSRHKHIWQQQIKAFYFLVYIFIYCGAFLLHNKSISEIITNLIKYLRSHLCLGQFNPARKIQLGFRVLKHGILEQTRLEVIWPKCFHGKEPWQDYLEPCPIYLKTVYHIPGKIVLVYSLLRYE